MSKKETVQNIRLTKHEGRKAITATRNIRIRAKASSVFLYLPETSDLVLETEDGIIRVDTDTIKSLRIEEVVRDVEQDNS